MNERERLLNRIAQLELQLASVSVMSTTDSDGESASGSIDTPVTTDLTQPFDTGQLVLSSTGNLHLAPSATFYRPAYVISEWQHALERLNAPTVSLPGYLASYLPFPMAESHHAHLIDLAFDCLLTFGINPFKRQFLTTLKSDPDSRGWYFSPTLHLSLLGIGWRYCRDEKMIAMYYPKATRSLQGQAFIERAKNLILPDMNAPCLGAILSLFVMSLYHVGFSQE